MKITHSGSNSAADTSSTENVAHNIATNEVRETSEVLEKFNDIFSCKYRQKEFRTHSGMRHHMSTMHRQHVSSDSPVLHVNNLRLNSSVLQIRMQQNVTLQFKNCIKISSSKNSQVNETNAMQIKLKSYHDKLLQSISNTSTERVTDQVKDILQHMR